MRYLIFVVALLYQSPCLAQAADAVDTSEGISNTVITALIGGLVALVPVLFQIISNRARRKSSEYKLSSLASELEFLEKWSALYDRHQQVDEAARSASTAANVASKLEDVYSRYLLITLHGHKEIPTPATNLSFLRRAFLLFKPTSAKGWLYHTIFYYFAIFMPWVGVETLINVIKYGATQDDTDLLVGLAVFFVALIFVSLAANRDRLKNLEELQKSDNQNAQ